MNPTADGSGSLQADLREIYRAGLEAAAPAAILARELEGSAASGWRLGGEPLLPPAAGEPVLVFGAGKAAAALAAGVRGGLAGETVRGRIIVKHGHGAEVPGIAVEEAGHPIPDRDSVRATERLIADLRAAAPGSRVLFLLTGGASALLVAPAAGVSFEEKCRTNELLIASGADIHEINTVRKHLSAVKGGQLLPLLPRGRSAVLLISDVVGDDLTSIGSGPATGDPTTFAAALAALARHSLTGEVPAGVLRRLREGAAGGVPETPSRPEHPAPHRILASNALSLDAAARAAERLGYRVEVFGCDLIGGVHETARAFARRLCALASAPGRSALLAGGELTLRVTGDGRGGRSQEFALVAGAELAGCERVALLAAGTDGSDGPTDAAGAFADGTSWARARGTGLDPAAALRRNDSGTLLGAIGDRFVTGPTGTNVMDLMLGVTGSR